ncbi:predicted protein [Histoplasma capsulatum G186AR]|uniref:Uncharacterized protein n=1 Tax=Ajellomyces capsulatus (strain G186AR / H82 / ATCC MYA-2454 / RMSCC 2432) TaxID=447093 RepID=C0NA88_AJECG|nr:uncharacterized protein HCBG_00034 [Histoplasma capsulatum G186AR]EEH10579.1 predicted protein [Histoplasma capsulatum G186AR]
MTEPKGFPLLLLLRLSSSGSIICSRLKLVDSQFLAVEFNSLQRLEDLDIIDPVPYHFMYPSHISTPISCDIHKFCEFRLLYRSYIMWIPDESPPPYVDLYPRVKRRTIWKARIKNLLQRLSQSKTHKRLVDGSDRQGNSKGA